MSTNSTQSKSQSLSTSQTTTNLNQSRTLTPQQLGNIDQILEMVQSLINMQASTPTLKDKLKSRKFWLAIALIFSGICGLIGFNDNTTAIVVFAILEIVGVVGYWISEGGLDKVRAQELTVSIMTLIDMLNGKIDAESAADAAIDDAESAVDENNKT